MERLRQAFLWFRRGNVFVFALASFISLWFLLQYAVGLFDDQDHGTLNLVLSIEASLATSFLLDLNMKQGERDSERTREIQEGVDEVQEELKHHFKDEISDGRKDQET